MTPASEFRSGTPVRTVKATTCGRTPPEQLLCPLLLSEVVGLLRHARETTAFGRSFCLPRTTKIRRQPLPSPREAGLLNRRFKRIAATMSNPTAAAPADPIPECPHCQK